MYTTDGSMFEGLFVRALRVQAGSELAEDLRRAGFDLRRIQSHYDISIWAACVDVAWRHLYPRQSRDEAWRFLGRRFIEGYFETAIGAVIAAVLPFMGASRFVERVPNFLRTGLSGSTCEVDVLGAGHAVLKFVGPHPRSAILMAGVIEVCFERLGERVNCAASELPGDDSLLEVRWGAALAVQ